MKKVLVIPVLSCCLVLFSCALGTPKDVLDKNKMQEVLWDVAKGGEFVNGFVSFRYPELNRAALNQKVLEEVFKIHGITKKQFDKSLEYYQRKPELFIAILDSINTRQNRIASDTSGAQTAPAETPGREAASPPKPEQVVATPEVPK